VSDRWNWDEEEEETPAEAPREKREPGRARRRDQAAGETEGRNNWYLLTGVILGLGIGLLIAWVISPVRYTDTAPASLDSTYKDEYRRTIALAYQASGNLDRARERLALLDPGGSIQILAAQAQRILAENRPPQEARVLAVLAADLGNPQAAARSTPGPTAQPVAAASLVTPTSRLTLAESQTAPAATTAAGEQTGIPAAATQGTVAAIRTPTLPPPTRTPTVTPTAPPTFTPRPSATPLPVLDAPYVLTEQKEVCDGSMEADLLQIYVTGPDGEPQAGVRILVSTQEKQEVFFTGLFSEISPGYADFRMEPGTLYSLSVGEISEPLNGLQTNGTCGWQVYYAQDTGG
jgi:hypothetical protein